MALCLDANGTGCTGPATATRAVLARARRARHRQRQLRAADRRPARQHRRRRSTRSRAAAPRRWSCATTARFCNRDEEIEPPFEHRSDSEIAEELFGRFDADRATRASRRPTRRPRRRTRRGTVLQFLRELARANDRHAYVLPGDERGASIGCFLPDPQGPADLPPLVLIGDGRNLANASVDAGPRRRRAHAGAGAARRRPGRDDVRDQRRRSRPDARPAGACRPT